MKKINKLNILSVIYVVISLIFIISLIRLNVLPNKYLIPVIIIYILFNIIGIVFINRKNKVLKIISIIFLSLLSIGSLISTYFINSTNNFINNSFNNKTKQEFTYYVIGLSKNNLSEEDINGDIGYYKNSSNIDAAIEYLNNKFSVTTNGFDDLNNLFDKLNNEEEKIILIEKSSYNIILSLDSNHKSDDYKIIYEFKVEKELKIDNKKSNSFNIYIVGSDFAGMMDLNMIATINQDTHKILLTSIPRDYYIEVAGYNGTKDKLSFITQSVDVSMESLELLFGTDIDYYLKIDTNSLVTLVDQIGGIEYCSDVEFTTTHAQVLNTYNDSYGRKLHIVKGCQHLNGVQTLTVARERNAFPGRDRVRQQNCQKIMIAIFKKIATIDTIGRYNDVLNAVSNSYETNISRDIITSNIKDVLNNGNKWTIETQSVDGSDGHDRVHLNTAVDWVMYPNMDTVNTAKEKINNIMK